MFRAGSGSWLTADSGFYIIAFVCRGTMHFSLLTASVLLFFAGIMIYDVVTCSTSL